MTEQSRSGTGYGNGAGVIFRDSRLGQLTAALVTAGGLAVVEWLGDLDFSTFPKAIATLGPVAAGLAAGWITARQARRTAR